MGVGARPMNPTTEGLEYPGAYSAVDGSADRAAKDNLLSDGLFTIRTGTDEGLVTLPGLISRLLTTDDVVSFPRVSADRFGYFWRFLVRTAGKALKTIPLDVEAAGSMEQSALEEAVLGALLVHTEETDWALFQPDDAKPGFLQVPLEPGKTLKESKYRQEDCSLLTAIIGTKGHERKIAVSRELPPEDVVYALIEYQTGTIFGGRGNYESQLTGSRSGAGSGTPFMGGKVGNSVSLTFAHDVAVILKTWRMVEEDIGLKGPVWALWREPWNGATPLLSTKLDPAFVPLARMVRLAAPMNGRYSELWFRPSDRSRVEDHTGGGYLGDIFTPTITDPSKGHRKVRGTLEKGYDYLEVYNLLFGEGGQQRAPSVAELISSPTDRDDLSVVFEGLALSQGKTLGFHRREIKLPGRFLKRGLIVTQPRVDAIHGAMLKSTQESKRILRSALAVLWKDNPRVRDHDRKKVDAIADELDRRVDQIYIDTLLEAAATDEPLEAGTLPYRKWLFDVVTSDVFPAAVRSVPRSTARAMQALTRAEAYLRSGLRSALDLPLPTRQPEEAEG